MKNFIKKIDKDNKIYLLGYNSDISGNKIGEYIFDDEAAKFAKKYGIEYEYITLEDIYKVKAIIIENVKLYLAISGN